MNLSKFMFSLALACLFVFQMVLPTYASEQIISLSEPFRYAEIPVQSESLPSIEFNGYQSVLDQESLPTLVFYGGGTGLLLLLLGVLLKTGFEDQNSGAILAASFGYLTIIGLLAFGLGLSVIFNPNQTVVSYSIAILFSVWFIIELISFISLSNKLDPENKVSSFNTQGGVFSEKAQSVLLFEIPLFSASF